MPTYEYACAACAHEWETVQRITEPPLGVCPKCLKPDAHRLISAGTNFILKGGGWYSDLYASPKAASSKAETAEAAPAAGAKADVKSESKADSSSDSSSGSESKSVPKTPAAPAPSSPSSPST